jgi:hypothetical protein
MPKNALKILGIVIAAFILFSAQAVFASGTKTSNAMATSDANLHFILGTDAAYIYGTTTDDGRTIADIPLSLYKSDAIAGSLMGPIIITIIYPKHVLSYYETTSEVWATQYYTARYSGLGPDYDTVTVNYFGPGIAVPTNPTIFAHLKFRPVNQHKEGDAIYLDFCPVWNYNNVTINNGTTIDNYYPSSYAAGRGSVVIDDYLARATIHNATNNFLGTYVEIPIYYTTNFLMYSIHDQISYDNAKLQFVTWNANPVFFPAGLVNGGYVVNNGSSISIDLSNVIMENYPFYAPEMPDSVWAYKLKFKIINNTPPITTDLQFINIATKVPLVADKYSWISWYDVWNNGIDHLNGTVTVPDYLAYLEAPKAVGGTTIKKHEGNIDFSVRMQNQFPAGMANNNSPGTIRINFDMGVSEWVYIGRSAENSNIKFDKNDYENSGHTWITFKQKYLTGTGLNWWEQRTTFDELFKMRLQYQGPTTYADDEATLSFNETYPDGNLIAQVKDTTNYFAATHSNTKLHWTNVTYDVELGGFHASNATSQNTSGSQPLFIRWNFNEPITAFSVQVNCSRVYSVLPYPGSGVQVTGGSGVYTVSYSSSPGMAYPGAGELIQIATIYYSVNCPYGKLVAAANIRPDGPYYSSATVYLTNPSITTATGSEWAVTDTSTVTGLCPGRTPRDAEVNENISDPKAGVAGLPTEYQLYQNHPNPFNPETIISYDVPKPTQVKIVVMNILGQEVATLLDEPKSAGRYEIVWRGIDDNGGRVSSGVYLCVMRAGNFHSMVKMSLMK